MSAPAVLLFQRKGDPTRAQLMAGNYPKRKFAWRGLTIAIETEAGELRSGTDRHGKNWSVRLPFSYGYVLGTVGADGEAVDAFIGPYPDAPMVYIVRARKYGDWSTYDEDKCFLSFDCAESAQAAFRAAYCDERFEGETITMPFEAFKAKVLRGPDGMVKAEQVTLMLMPIRVSGSVKRDGGTIRPHTRLQHVKPESDVDRIARTVDIGPGTELRHRDGGRWAVIMPDAAHEDKHRYQVYNDRGLKEHHTFDSHEAAVRAAVQAGFVLPDPGSMDRLAPVWAARFADPEKQAAASKSGDRVAEPSGDFGIVDDAVMVT